MRQLAMYNKKRTGMRLLVWSIVLFALLGCTSNTSQKQSITIIGTADIQGLMYPFSKTYEINGSKKEIVSGGISRIATVLKNAQEENPFRTFVLSSGDDLMGRYFHTFKGKAIYSLMSKSRYMLYAPGNHEFDKGPKVFAQALDYAKFETICSDLAIENTYLEGKCIPYKIIEAEGTKIGFFSLMTEELPLITSPGNVKLSANNLVSAQKMVKILQDAECDVIVGITHIGLDQDKIIAKNVKGIDVIFGGHSHKVTHSLVRVNDTLIMNGGEEGSYVVKLDLPLDEAHKIKKEGAAYEVIPIIAPLEKEKYVEALLESYKAQLPATIILGKTTVEWDLTTDALRKNESNVADLINDLLRDKFAVDIVMNNAGAFRGKKVYPPGNITDTMLHEIDEFSNNAYMMSMEGKYLRQILEHSAALYGEGGLMQVSGIRYTINLSKQAQVINHDNNGRWVMKTPGERVSKITIVDKEGKQSPLDDKKIYKVLSNAYLVTHAGDGYFWFDKYGKDPKNTYTTFYTVMASYLETHKIMNPKPLDGRLKIKK